MFTRKKEIQRKQAIIDSLNTQNQRLRIENAEQREEYDNALEAKEAERLEICDQLGQLQEQRRKDKDTIERQANTIGRLIKENAWLIKTNANLSSKLNIKRGADGRFVSTKKDHE